MASIVVSDRTGGKSRRQKLENIDLSEKISSVREKASKLLNIPGSDIELVYCGQLLNDERTLQSYGIKLGVTVHILRKHQPDMEESTPEPMDSTDIRQVVTALQAALINPAYRNTVEQMLHDQETLENIIAAAPGLGKDPVAIAMLQSAEMLAILADPSHVNKVIEAHPSLGHAAMMVAAAVNEEAAKGATGSGSSRGTYSLDQMSDDEDLEVPMRPPVLPHQAQGGATASQPITTSQLAAALAAASAMPTLDPMPSTSGQGSRSRPQGPTAITTDIFQQALAQASQQQTQVVTESQLAQLRDMGFTDEAVARQALQATNGDIQAAIELLFSDTFQ